MRLFGLQSLFCFLDIFRQWFLDTRFIAFACNTQTAFAELIKAIFQDFPLYYPGSFAYTPGVP
jgi:hypothetical protein